MPKIIPDLEKTILDTARAVLLGEGYSAFSLRTIARRCSIAVGTIYNYFKDKNTLVATVMLEDWQRCLDTIRAVAENSSGPGPVLRCIHEEIWRFSVQYGDLFRDRNAQKSFSSAFSQYHGQLRDTLAEPLRRFFADAFTPAFIAEALLTWTVEGRGYDELGPILGRIYERCDET